MKKLKRVTLLESRSGMGDGGGSPDIVNIIIRSGSSRSDCPRIRGQSGQGLW